MQVGQIRGRLLTPMMAAAAASLISCVTTR